MNTSTAPSEAARRYRQVDAGLAADLILRHRAGVLPRLAVFDVRDAASFEAGHIAGARHLPAAELGEVLASLSRATPVLIYCHRGQASQAVASSFGDFRFPEVYSVEGGFAALQRALAPSGAPRAAPALAPDASPALRDFVARHGFDAGDLDAARAGSLTPLMRAALEGDAALVEELLAGGVTLAARNGDGNNALWLACVGGSMAAIGALLAAGIDIDNRNDLGATCLMYAASSGKVAVLGALIAAGADAQITNFDDARAVDLCASRECLRLLRALPAKSLS